MSEVLKAIESLGVDKEELVTRIVNRAAVQVVDHCFSMADDQSRYKSLRQQVTEVTIAHVDDALSAIMNQEVMPMIDKGLHRLLIHQTNKVGEEKAPPMTLREYIQDKTEKYLGEAVDNNGKVLGNGGEEVFRYNKSAMTRLSYLIDARIKEAAQYKAQALMADIVREIGKPLQQALQEAVNRAAEQIKNAVRVK